MGDDERWPWWRRLVEERYFKGLAMGLAVGAIVVTWVPLIVVLILVGAWALLDLVLPS